MNATWLRFLPDIMRRRLDGRRGLQQAMGNTAWLMVDRMARLVLGIGIAVWMARVLGPVRFGQLNFALAYVALFASFAGLGLEKVVVRDLVRSGVPDGELLGTAFVLKLAGACVAIALCIASMLVTVRDSHETQLLIAVLSLGFLFHAFDVIDYRFQSRVESRYVVLARLPSLLVFFAVRAWLVVAHMALVYFAWAQTLELLLAGIGLVAVFRYRKDVASTWRPAVSTAKALLGECWPLILAGLSVIFYMRIDVVMLGKLSGEHAAGIYSAATRLSEGFYFIPMIIASSVAPMLVRARAAGAAPYFDGLMKLYLAMVRVSLGIAIPLAMLAPWLVDLLYGAAYAEAATVLRVHVWAAVAVFLGTASSQYLMQEGLQKISLYRTLAGLAVNVVLNLYLIPMYGATGAAVATLVSYFVSTFCIMLSPRGLAQGLLMLRAMNPLVIVGHGEYR